MGKRSKGKRTEAGQMAGGVTVQEQAEMLLRSWATRQLEEKLQCSNEDAQEAAVMALTMSTQELNKWCRELLSGVEKNMDPDRRFYNQMLDKKEELGLLDTGLQQASESGVKDDVSEAGTVTSVATTATTATSKKPGYKPINHSGVVPLFQMCGCEARKHKLLTNCILCGKVVCEQEGWGRCWFCGAKLDRNLKEIKEDKDSPELQKALQNRDRLLEYQEQRSKRTVIYDDQEDYYESVSNQWLSPEERKAAEEKEKKLREERIKRFKKGGAYAVSIDFVNKNISMGLSHSDSQNTRIAETPVEKRAKEQEQKRSEETPAAQKEAEEQSKEENSENICMSSTIYTAGEIVVQEVSDTEDEDGETVKGYRVMRCPDAKAALQFDNNAVLKSWIQSTLESYGYSESDAIKQAGYLCRMTNYAAIRGWANENLEDPTLASEFVSAMQQETDRLETAGHLGGKQPLAVSAQASKSGGGKLTQNKGTGRIQSDWEDLDDTVKAPVENMVGQIKKKKPWVYINSPLAAKIDAASNIGESNQCLSMHQPWASLLVCGIKKHEGRVWGSDFRGRLWIHAASHAPSEEDIEDTEAFYASRGATTFPTHYPTSVLLGCVTVTNVLHYTDYAEKIPKEDQESNSEYVFICKNPQLLVLPLPMDGKHKIFAFDKSIHEAVKRQAGRKDV
eukprot:TRINITY_DN12861_c0_g1_i1.p1 TRINITY_DN12861_c0_g1~~TRINITY_DN12861_c0_g1_i1.p1  ORF type:complete len:690 (+),score=153.32 TRINITY_DN12861_c0_g1_i1:41-2071(+)